MHELEPVRRKRLTPTGLKALGELRVTESGSRLVAREDPEGCDALHIVAPDRNRVDNGEDLFFGDGIVQLGAGEFAGAVSDGVPPNVGGRALRENSGDCGVGSVGFVPSREVRVKMR